MGLWNFFKKQEPEANCEFTPAPPQQLKVENRSFDRYYLQDQRFACLHLDNENIEVVSISYGGISTLSPQKPIASPSFSCQLSILGKRIDCDVKMIYQNEKNMGLQFLHMQPQCLLFLRGYLEYLRIGKSMQKISAEFTKQQDGQKLFFRGDGPTDLTLMPKQDASGELEPWLHLTLRQKQKYLECKLSDEIISTAKSIVKIGTSAQMIPDPSIDLETIAQTLCILKTIPKQNPLVNTEIITARLLKLF